MARRKQPPLLDLGRPAEVNDIFDQVVVGRPCSQGAVYERPGVLDPRWFFLGGIFSGKTWRSAYGLPKPEIARLLPEWAYSIMRIADRLVVEDMLMQEARYLCVCDPGYGETLLQLLIRGLSETQ